MIYDDPKLWVIGVCDPDGMCSLYGWADYEIPKKAVRRYVPKLKGGAQAFCAPWYRFYSNKGEAKSELYKVF